MKNLKNLLLQNNTRYQSHMKFILILNYLPSIKSSDSISFYISNRVRDSISFKNLIKWNITDNYARKI